MSQQPNTPLQLNETASQTGGPYVHIGLAPEQAGFQIFEKNFGPILVDKKTKGERIALEGMVYDGSGTLMRDVLIEIWQADAKGHYAHPADPKPSTWRGWGRTGADFKSGRYRFETIKPGRVVGPDGRLQAPHIAMILFARGINIGLQTRVYFSDEGAANAEDAVLGGIEWEARRQTLIARREERKGETVYRFDIHVQGPTPAEETVFFDL
ncbi:MAG: protocatechuate 3,4-dioxygenase subunit alpha [Pseudomonadota bacterium]